VVDVLGAIKTAPYADLAICIYLFAWVILGVAQGPLRRGLGILAMLLAFIFAANLRDTVGTFLHDNWTQFNLEYNKLLAFILIFCVGWVIASIAITGFYKRAELSAAHPIVDDLLGALLGLLEGVLLLLIVVIVMNSYVLPSAKPGDIGQLRDFQNTVVNQSEICRWLKDVVASPFVHILGTFLPGDLVEKF
jgi:uncharacterized membrane protein required for colicin V production